MFKLQRLEITGFKSFADHTEILFTGDGITAVVGPNGCGKSNVADAIAWVLGEQRVKHLRGSEMKDVIFQGSRNRLPSGMAEVVLHMVRDDTIETEPEIEDIDSTLEQIDDTAVSLDSSGPPDSAELQQIEPTSGDSSQLLKTSAKRHWRRRNLALEFAPGEAVSVSRRLYRSGESEYLLNNRLCRLRDIQDLFSGTGLSGAHYAIIEQGRIGQILSAKPMDRRTIVEEAAGITKFRVRQRAAEARLESARSNLARISDIISEIDRQVNALRRQAAKARRFGVLRDQLKTLLKDVYVAEGRRLATAIAETDEKLGEFGNAQRNLADSLSRREEETRAATKEARRIEDQLSSCRAAAAEAVLRRDRELRELGYQQDQLSALEQRKTQIAREMEALSARLVLIEAECQRLQDEDIRLRNEADQSAQLLGKAEETHSIKLALALDTEARIEREREELLKQTAIVERLREIAYQLTENLERLALQTEGLSREGERAVQAYDDRKAAAEKVVEELKTVKANLERLTAERENAVDAVVQGHEAVSDTDAELARVREEYSRTKHRLESLKDLDDRRAYYSPAVQMIFSQTDVARDFHFIGTLADALNVDAKWERAVEGVLGSSLQSVVVPTPDDAVRAAQWLRENNGGRASFLVAGLRGASDETDTLFCKVEERTTLTRMHSAEVTDDLRIRDLLGAPAELITVLNRTLPQKMNARIASNLEDAMTRSLRTGELYVTLNGDWVASGQLVHAGDARDLEEGAGLLAFKRELRELEARGTVLEAQFETAQMEARAARERLVGLEDAVLLLNEAIGREEREVLALEMNIKALTQEIERAERHVRVVADDKERLEDEKVALECRRVAALTDAEAAESARVAATESINKATALLAETRREAELEGDGLAKQRAHAAAAAERRRATATDLRRVETERTELAQRIDQHNLELIQTGARVNELVVSNAELKRNVENVNQETANEEEEISLLAAQLEEARHKADTLAVDLSDLNRRAGELRELRAASEIHRAEAHARLTFVRENCNAELGLSLEGLVHESMTDVEFDLETGQSRVEELRRRLESFGAVNMMALEELAEAEERLLFLTSQRLDITDSITATEEALREIKRRSRERFRQAFEQINLNFGELFRELFGGGRGEMSLIDADDVLESGIDIIAQPPGKRLQNVLLLSGGEKAMAALALVLGIFQYRPAPFCLLDEVDAPLDEANVGRFTDKVRQMSESTQFIVITHNKKTMEMARALYGVTMEEVGISKLVSVKFE